MTFLDLQGKMTAVLGYGLEGAAVTEYLLKHGVKPVLFDQKPWQNWPIEEQETIKKLGLNFIFGPDAFKELAGFDIAFRSPGIPLSNKDLMRIKNLSITSQTKWFFDNCPAKIIGVTGTKGKGTTASLIKEMLDNHRKASNLSFQTYLTGNIGKIGALEILDELTAEDWVIYELSSFQLQDLKKSPHIAVILMVTSEHLDYHNSLDEYVKAKQSIAEFQTPSDAAVINADYPNSVKIGKLGAGKKYFYSINPSSSDFGSKITYDIFQKDGVITVPDSSFKLHTSQLALRGRHNWENVCAAIGVGKILGIDDNIISSSVLNFKGLEHRLEFVAEKQGIKFYNDSFSTTPETAIAAINSFSEPEIIILGGSSKYSDFDLLGQAIVQKQNVKALIIIGKETDRILSAIQAGGGTRAQFLTAAENMEQIFKQLRSVAKQGDVVLLSPACASFDMFQNYKQRGEIFKSQVALW
jgi:UDP-N-acetylmuramoylalanine--D-glutamate ligase